MQRVDRTIQRQNLDRLIGAIKTKMMIASGLDAIQPQTMLGKRAMVLTESIAGYAAALTAVSGYTAVIQSISPPPITEQSGSSEAGVPEDVYDQYQNVFLPEWNQFQSIANQWMLPATPNSQGYYQQLATVPNNLIAMNYSVGNNLFEMMINQPGSSNYDQAQKNLLSEISMQSSLLSGLIGAVNQYSNHLATATENVIASADSGVLQTTMQQYETEINDLNDQIADTNTQLHEDEMQLLKDGGKALGFAAMAVVGIVGMKIKDPVTKVLGGMITIAGGIGFATEIYDIVEDCIAISKDKSQINVLNNDLDNDQTTALALGVMINQIDGFAGMESAAVEALQEVLNGYKALADELDDIVTDVTDNEVDAASDEWTAIYNAATNLSANVSYFWPDIYSVYECKSMAPTSTGVNTIATDGTIYQYDSSGTAWSKLPGTAVSLAASDSVLVRINATPISVLSEPVTNTYYASQFIDNAWVDISDFAVGNIAVYGSNIYAVRSNAGSIDTGNQPASDLSEVLQYSGSGTTWNSLGSPDSGDLPGFIAAFDGGVIVSTLLSGLCYFWDGNKWNEIGSSATQYLSPVAAGTNFSLIDINYNSSLASTTRMTPSITAHSIYRTAVTGGSSPTQYVVTATGTLECVTGSGGSYQTSSLRDNSMAIFGDVTGQNFYLLDTTGNMYQCQGSGTAMTFSKLPALPSS